MNVLNRAQSIKPSLQINQNKACQVNNQIIKIFKIEPHSFKFKMLQHINKLFIVIIALSILTYFERPDYNLPLFFFVLALWDNNHHYQRQRLWYLITFSALIDFIWIIYWAAVWSGYENREKGLGNFTIFLSVLILIVKFAVIILTFLKDEKCKRSLAELPGNLKNILKAPEAGHYA